MFCMHLKRSNSSSKTAIKIGEIGMPTDFKVIQHVGLNSDKSSFEVNFLNFSVLVIRED
jgi:hypothetical protein